MIFVSPLQQVLYRNDLKSVHLLIAGVAFLIIIMNPCSSWADVLWSTSHETGDLSDWYKGEGGGVFNTGGSNA